MKLNLGIRAYGAAKAYFLGYGLVALGVAGFPVTQVTGGVALAIGKFIGKKNPAGNFLQRVGDALLTAPISGAWFGVEALATIITGENKVMGVKKINSSGQEEIRGAGYIMTDVLPHMVKSVGKYMGIIKSPKIIPDKVQGAKNGAHAAKGKEQNMSPASTITPTPTPKKMVFKTKNGWGKG